MPAKMNPEKTRQFELYIAQGYKINEAGRMAGVSNSWADAHMRDMRTGGNHDTTRQRNHRQRLVEGKALGRPRRKEELCPEALKALGDFTYFRQRYFGHLSTPWQAEATDRILDWLGTPHEEYAVFNEPPGTGKSTLVVDLGAWLTVRDRSIRAVIGSATMVNARRQVSRLRRALERETPVTAKLDEVRRGLACDAESTLAADFGLFRPTWQADVWRGEEFVVIQADEQPIDEKEPTWSAVGMDTGFLGNRYNLIIWDDVVTKKTLATVEAIDKQRDWWDDEAESRLEPGGLMLLVGQRMASADLYRYCLDKLGADEDDEPDQDSRQYHHVVYMAHDADRCVDQHETDAPAWPDGCLLDPKRASWRKLRRLQRNQPRTYAVQYQQEDADPEAALVNPLWVAGGLDPVTKIRYLGCWDEDRTVGEKPDLPGQQHWFVTVDPSPTRYWAAQVWCYIPTAGNQLLLIDCYRDKADSNTILGRNPYTGVTTGLLADWVAAYPVRHIVFEVNAAQTWFFRERWRAEWAASKRVRIVEHSTGVRKTSPELGVPSIGAWFESGRIRLPGADQASRKTAQHLVNEVTRYPNAGTDDQVMACWFAVLHLPTISRPTSTTVTQPRPSWLTSLPRAI